MAQSFNRVGNAPRVGIHLAGRRKRGPLGTRLNSQFLRRAVWLQCVELVQGGGAVVFGIVHGRGHRCVETYKSPVSRLLSVNRAISPSVARAS